MADPVLLTPGPLTTSRATKEAMLRDWCSRDAAFSELTASVCRDLAQIANAGASHTSVPLQGSGTFAVEAALGTLVPKFGKVLVPNNGAYCQRIVRILNYLDRQAVVIDLPENAPVDPLQIDKALLEDSAITHVALVHCETGTGLLNPLPDVAVIVATHGRRLIIDAMSSFGIIPIDAQTMPFDAVIAASGKCLEGVPGMGFVIARHDVLEAAKGNCHSLALDLSDQWDVMRKTGQWRFTPPTHVVAALRAAIDQYHAEGGQPGRLSRYAQNCDALVSGLRDLGLQTFLDDRVQAPVIVTFHAPRDPGYNFDEFSLRVANKGFVLYPGKLTKVNTFRVGCIGAIGVTETRRAVAAITQSFADMNVRDFGKA